MHGALHIDTMVLASRLSRERVRVIVPPVHPTFSQGSSFSQPSPKEASGDGGAEEYGLARAQVFHAAPGSLFSAAQNSLFALDLTETGERSNIFADRLLPSRLPSKNDPVGLNPRMSLAPPSSTPKIETRRNLPKMNGVRGRGHPHQPGTTSGSPKGSGVRTDGGYPKPGPRSLK